MAPQPQPSPVAQLPPNLQNDITALSGAANPAQTGSLYGLNSAGQAAKFDLSGLGLGSGQMSGGDLLKLFLAAGQSPDPQTRAVAAAIQHALYYGNYYGKSTTPTFGEVSKQDADALGRALTDLNNANQAQVGSSPSGPTRMSVAQFLTSQAAVGAANGPTAASQAVAPQIVNVRAPNAADVAATYEKVAQQLLGHRPDSSEVSAFVNSYTQQYVANERANDMAQYNALVQKAQVKNQQSGQTPTLPTPPAPYTYGGGSAGAAEFGQNGAPQDGYTYGGGSAGAAEFGQNGGTPPGQPLPGETPTLSDAMGTLQDAINANAQASQSTGAPGLIEAGTNAPESADVAAQDYARNTHPNEAAAGDLNSTFGTFLSLIGAHMGGIN